MHHTSILKTLLIRNCENPTREFSYLTMLCGVTGFACAAGMGLSTGNFFGGALLGAAGYILAYALAISRPVTDTSVKFTLSGGLLGSGPSLHLPTPNDGKLLPKALFRDLGITLQSLDKTGIQEIALESFLLGKPERRSFVKHRLEQEIMRNGLSWTIQDKGHRRFIAGDICCWITYFGFKKIGQTLNLGKSQPLDLSRFKESDSFWMPWGKLILVKH